LALLVDPTDVWLLAEDIELFESLVITDAVETIFPMQMIIIIIMEIVMMMRRIIITSSSINYITYLLSIINNII